MWTQVEVLTPSAHAACHMADGFRVKPVRAIVTPTWSPSQPKRHRVVASVIRHLAFDTSLSMHIHIP